MAPDLQLLGTSGQITMPSLTFLPSFLASCCLFGAAASIPSHFSPSGCLPGSLSQLPWPDFLHVALLLFFHQTLSIPLLRPHVNTKTSWKSEVQEETTVVLELYVLQFRGESPWPIPALSAPSVMGTLCSCPWRPTFCPHACLLNARGRQALGTHARAVSAAEDMVSNLRLN